MTDFDYDVVGVGCGPANMAIAVAIDEAGQVGAPSAPLRAAFFDRAPQPQWHADMMIPGSSMQISHLKDLVTLRNPMSRFTFVNFLHQRDRLVPFINRGNVTPLRAEFAAYLAWVAGELAHLVRYGHEVRSIGHVVSGGRIEGYTVEVDQQGATRTVTARHVIHAPGLVPHVPPNIALSQRIRHNASFLADLNALDVAVMDTVVVAGAGQSAAEVVTCLLRRAPSLHVHSVTSGMGLPATDQSPYTNSIFDPETVDVWFEATPQQRQELLARHANTNYGAASLESIRELFDLEYEEYWEGKRRIFRHNLARVSSAEQRGDAVQVTIDRGGSQAPLQVTADALFLATGYKPASAMSLVTCAEDFLCCDAQGNPAVRRDFSARQHLPDDGKLFLVGSSEGQHGLTATLLSVVASRADEILRVIMGSLPAPHEVVLPR